MCVLLNENCKIVFVVDWKRSFWDEIQSNTQMKGKKLFFCSFESFGDIVPVHHIPNRFQIVRSCIFVLKVVRMLQQPPSNYKKKILTRSIMVWREKVCVCVYGFVWIRVIIERTSQTSMPRRGINPCTARRGSWLGHVAIWRRFVSLLYPSQPQPTWIQSEREREQDTKGINFRKLTMWFSNETATLKPQKKFYFFIPEPWIAPVTVFILLTKFSNVPHSFSISFNNSPVGFPPPPFLGLMRFFQNMLWFTCPPPTNSKFQDPSHSINHTNWIGTNNHILCNVW